MSFPLDTGVISRDEAVTRNQIDQKIICVSLLLNLIYFDKLLANSFFLNLIFLDKHIIFQNDNLVVWNLIVCTTSVIMLYSYSSGKFSSQFQIDSWKCLRFINLFGPSTTRIIKLNGKRPSYGVRRSEFPTGMWR